MKKRPSYIHSEMAVEWDAIRSSDLFNEIIQQTIEEEGVPCSRITEIVMLSPDGKEIDLIGCTLRIKAEYDKDIRP